MWPQFLAYSVTLGIPIASVYQIRKHPEQASSVAAAALLVSALMGSVASIIGFLVIPHSLHSYSPGLIRFAQWAMLISPLSLLGVTLATMVQSAGAFRWYNFFRVAQPLSIVCVLCIGWIAHGVTVSSAALTYLLAGIPITVWNGVWVYRHFRPRLSSGSMEVMRPLFSYGLRAWGADLLGTVANQVDRLLVVSMLPAHAMGMYVVSQSVAGLLNVLPSAVNTILLPSAAGRPLTEVAELTGRAVRATLAGLLLIATPLFFFGGALLAVVYGNKYDGAAGILRILLGEAILDGVTSVLAQAFMARGLPGTVTLLEGCGLFTAVPLMYWLIPRYGLQGAAYALLLATACRFSFVIGSYPLRLGMKIPSMMLRASDVSAFRRAR